MINAPVLQSLNFAVPFLVSTDASIKSVAGILSQDFGQGYQPICYESQKLNSAEQNYPVHELEHTPFIIAFASGDAIWRDQRSLSRQIMPL